MKNQSLIYLLIAVVVVGAVYFVLRDQSTTTPAPATTQEAMSDSVTVNLTEQNDSGLYGTATLTEADGKTTVVFDLVGAPAGASQPAHIHVGACPEPGAVEYPLGNVVAGVSTTVLDVTLDQLKGMLPLAINVHKSAAEVSVYVACGDLVL